MSRLLLIASCLCLAASVHGAEVRLTAIQTGWYDDLAGPNPTGSPNYFTGDGGTEHRSFFLFDVSSLATRIPPGQPILAADLIVETGVFVSQDPSETLGLFDVTTSVAQINDGSDFLETFADLGSGQSYGDYVYSEADEATSRVLPLSAAAIADLTAASLAAQDQVFGIGGAILTLDGTPATNLATSEYIFGVTESLTSPVLAVRYIPSPTGSSLALVASFLVAFRMRR